MLTTVARLFGKSPFVFLQAHMRKVRACIEKLTEITEGLERSSQEELGLAVAGLTSLEREADLAKNEIYQHLTRHHLFSINRLQFLEILSIQNGISDRAGEIGNLLTLYPMQRFGGLCEQLTAFFQKNVEAFWHVYTIIETLHIAISFGGKAHRVQTAIKRAFYAKREADQGKQLVTKQLFSTESELSISAFYLCTRLIEEIHAISHTSEKLASRILMMLSLK